jgi:hypothetical protein
MMSDLLQTLRLTIHPEAEVDEEKLFDQTAQLKEELQALETTSVDLVKKSSAPAGAKAAGDPAFLGTLLLTLAASGGVLTTLISALSSWLTRNNACSITLEIGGDKLEIKGASAPTQERLTNAWVERHGRKE